MASSRRSQWEQAPVSSERQPDAVPTRSLPPLSSLDLRSDGQKIGPCPRCGSNRWWDNRGAKRAGQLDPTIADFVCARCRHTVRESDAPAPFKPVTKLAAEDRSGADRAGFRQCTSTTKRGTRCNNGAMAGMEVCGPHASTGAVAASSNQCRGVTKNGKPCKAGALRGEEYCPAHQDQALRQPR
jgi:hypothetical protein